MNVCKYCGNEINFERYKNAGICSQICYRESMLKKARDRYRQKNGYVQNEILEQYIVSALHDYYKYKTALPVDVSKPMMDLFMQNADIEYQTNLRVDEFTYDYYIPAYNLLVNINSTVTHSSELQKAFGHTFSRYYHSVSTKNAMYYGYKCLQIFDYDDISRIVCALSNTQEVVDCNKSDLTLVDISVLEAIMFAQLHNLLYIPSRYDQYNYIGLTYKEELIGCLTYTQTSKNIKIIDLFTDIHYNCEDGVIMLLDKLQDMFPELDIQFYYNYAYAPYSELFIKYGFKRYDTDTYRIWINQNKYETDSRLSLNVKDFESFKLLISQKISEGWLPIFNCGVTNLKLTK